MGIEITRCIASSKRIAGYQSFINDANLTAASGELAAAWKEVTDKLEAGWEQNGWHLTTTHTI